MGCILPILGLFCPRFLLFFIFLLTNWLSLAYQTVIWPVLGFFFMPFTTLAYMTTVLNNNNQVTGGWIVLLIVAVIFDISANSDTARRSNV